MSDRSDDARRSLDQGVRLRPHIYLLGGARTSGAALAAQDASSFLIPRRRVLTQLTNLRFRLMQPELHMHFLVHRHRHGEVFLSLVAIACTAIELAETEVAVGDKRAHAAGLGDRQRLAVVSLAAVRIGPV